jgi:arylsulfatase
MMEIYAGFLEQTDYNVGRMLNAIEKIGQLDNTLVIYIAGDNGASAEAGPHGMINENEFFNVVDTISHNVTSHYNSASGSSSDVSSFQR